MHSPLIVTSVGPDTGHVEMSLLKQSNVLFFSPSFPSGLDRDLNSGYYSLNI